MRLRLRLPRWQHWLLAVWVLVWMLGPGGTRCPAHPGNIAAALAKVQADGSFQVRVRFDLLAYTLEELPNRIADAPMNALLDGPPAELDSQLALAKARFRQHFQVVGSGPEAIETFTFPNAAEVLQGIAQDDRMRLPVMALVTVAGHVTPGTRTIAFQFDPDLGTIVLTAELPYQEPISEPVEAGASSTPLAIPTPESVAKAAAALKLPAPNARASVAQVVASPEPVRPTNRTAKTATPIAQATPSSATPSPLPTATPSPVATASAKIPAPAKASPRPTPSPEGRGITYSVTVPSQTALTLNIPEAPTPVEAPPARWLPKFLQYIKLGYTHILPEGLDHILFVLGLFLLSTRAKPLLKQVTAFTIAHSLTLALSLYGVVHLPASVVEPIIAASIAFVAIENLFTTEVKSGRLALVFGFGLIHGLGFAETLQELGLRHNDLLTALVGFNVGVELGQLSVVALAFLLVGRFRNHPNYRKYVVVPGSLAISALAIFWVFQRIL